MARARAARSFGRWLAAELDQSRVVADYRGLIRGGFPGDFRGLAEAASSSRAAGHLEQAAGRPWKALAALLGFAAGNAAGAEYKRRGAKRRRLRTAALAGRL